ncbi:MULTISPECIES: NUDIX hydrolase [Acinetobacter]|uniref:Putative MutT/nudix family protein n=1 Tax=Acinetobacter baylyi (strain ATCC 33305 / BD413 / ADP1) TaxID=62977 RepID=Q6FE78_ACIAD|nr:MULTISPECIES: NUDIX domain-containing protein [Acinetobacter]ENV55779.1 hypothetical protein F952_00407 [Acinetobacter baylyi DSM 14961 = CIP 107474]KAF2371519.1 NUDIX hydrolase [Acinetobacter baylyi]KAF2373454.1 NUDIX hydrolase [Acinetobacter baylyi]KAF2376699.1 NUDIX hydrolase [Acinetobacter baylyi]KAF2381451.1 NUDIX hydrolase [Acinetobacter baylyi]
MAFLDRYRVGAHAVIINPQGQILLLKATYGHLAWGLLGGAIDPQETIFEGLQRECLEELGVDIENAILTGIYLHSDIDAHVSIFRCKLPREHKIQLSHEHSEYAYFNLSDLAAIQRQRVEDSLGFNGNVIFRKF